MSQFEVTDDLRRISRMPLGPTSDVTKALMNRIQASICTCSVQYLVELCQAACEAGIRIPDAELAFHRILRAWTQGETREDQDVVVLLMLAWLAGLDTEALLHYQEDCLILKASIRVRDTLVTALLWQLGSATEGEYHAMVLRASRQHVRPSLWQVDVNGPLPYQAFSVLNTSPSLHQFHFIALLISICQKSNSINRLQELRHLGETHSSTSCGTMWSAISPSLPP